MLEQKIRKITRDLVQRDAEDKRRNPYAYDGFQSLYTSCIWSRLVPILPFIEMNHIVADFGCGLGWNAKLMSLFCQKVIGIDKSSEAIAVAKKKSGTTNTEWICGDMSESLLSEKIHRLSGMYSSVGAFGFETDAKIFFECKQGFTRERSFDRIHHRIS